MGDKLGSLNTGKIADVVIANGDPLDVRTIVKQVYQWRCHSDAKARFGGSRCAQNDRLMRMK